MNYTLRTTIYRYPRRQAAKESCARVARGISTRVRSGLLGLGALSMSSNAVAASYKVCQDVPAPKKLKRHKTFKGPHYRGRVVPEMLRYPLATTVWMEARNQPAAGRRAVAHVIVNRVHADKDRWGHGLMGVVTKRKQFSCHNVDRRGNIDVNRQAFFDMLKKPEDSPEKKLWHDIQRMSGKVWAGQDPDNTGGATFYATTSITPYWRYDMKVIGIMYDHAFFREATRTERAIAARDTKANRLLARARKMARKANTKKVKVAITHKIVIHGKKSH